MQDAGILDDRLDDAITKVSEACEVCTKNGRPKPSRKVSVTHVDESFNEEIQLDFMFINLKEHDIVILVITDTGTGYSELIIVESRHSAVFIRELEQSWVCRHGAPKAVSADDEYNRKPTINYLRTHNIQFKPRPARRHNKTGVVERKIQVVKSILYKMNNEKTNASVSTLVARASFMCNFFSGNRILSSFELVRGYSPSIIGIPARTIPPEILQAHREQAAIRALQRLFQSRSPSLAGAEMFSPDTPVWVYYRTSKQNERNRWIMASVVEAQEHFVLARRSHKGPPMRVAYEDIRPAPQSALTTELLSCSLEEELQASPGNVQATSHDQITRTETDSGYNPTVPLRLRLRLPANTPDTTQASAVPDEPPPRPDLEVAAIAAHGVRPNVGEISAHDEDHVDTSDEPHGSMLASHTSNKQRGPESDIGEYAERIANQNPNITASLTSDQDRIISKIYDIIGSKQVSARHLDFAPSWVLDAAFEIEHDSNWVGAYAEVPDELVPRQANVITSHTLQSEDAGGWQQDDEGPDSTSWQPGR